jgi:hypothetical protein
MKRPSRSAPHTWVGRNLDGIEMRQEAVALPHAEPQPTFAHGPRCCSLIQVELLS